MSHQSGIKPSATFSDELRSSQDRAVLVTIDDETLKVSKTLPVDGDWLQDLDRVPDWIEGPSYVIYFADVGVHDMQPATNSSIGTRPFFVFVYVPDTAAVRDKMLYASSKSTLLKTIGTPTVSYFGSLASEFSRAGYEAHIASEFAKPPLTDDEKIKNQVRSEEAIAEQGISARKLHAGGIVFPLKDDAHSAIQELANDSHPTSGVVLAIDKEEIYLVTKMEAAHYTTFTSNVPSDAPSFVLANGYPEETHSAFVYVCPQSSNIKSRMLYASSKGSLIEMLSSKDEGSPYGLSIVEKAEVESFDEWIKDTENAAKAKEEAASQRSASPVKRFAKPAKPGRGPARVV